MTIDEALVEALAALPPYPELCQIVICPIGDPLSYLVMARQWRADGTLVNIAKADAPTVAAALHALAGMLAADRMGRAIGS